MDLVQVMQVLTDVVRIIAQYVEAVVVTALRLFVPMRDAHVIEML